MPYERHPDIEAAQIPDDTRIWRFMSLSKFLELISSSSLYFTQLTELRKQDPFEGSITAVNAAYNRSLLTEESVARAHYGILADEPMPPNWREPSTSRTNNFAYTFYCSCWHIKEFESALLWNSYSAMDEGIAISSTVARLKEAIRGSDKNIYFGQVRYIDYNSEMIDPHNIVHRFFTKRLSFGPESELRAGFSHTLENIGISDACRTENPAGLQVPVENLVGLIEGVFVSPRASPWLQESLSNITNRLGISLNYAPSSIHTRPFE